MAETYVGTSRPCNRFHRDGRPCDNYTNYRDGWCRLPECDGFRRPSIVALPDDDDSREASRRTEPERIDKLPFGPEDADRARVSRRAIDSYLFHHGGERTAAIKDLIEIYRDFVTEAKKKYEVSDIPSCCCTAGTQC